MIRLLTWMGSSGFRIAVLMLVLALCITVYGNYESGKRLERLCDLTGPHDRNTSARGTLQAEADAICQNAEAEGD